MSWAAPKDTSLPNIVIHGVDAAADAGDSTKGYHSTLNILGIYPLYEPNFEPVECINNNLIYSKYFIEQYEIEFNNQEKDLFERYPSPIGVPIQQLKDFLNADASARKGMETGIPLDSTDNQLAMWILFSRQENPNVRATIKADSNTEFPAIKKVLEILQDNRVNRFNLVTSLEAVRINLDEIQQ